MIQRILIVTLLEGLACCSGAISPDQTVETAKKQNYQAINLAGFHDSIHHAVMRYEKLHYAQYKPEQIVHIAENLLLYQNEDGGWPTAP